MSASAAVELLAACAEVLQLGNADESRATATELHAVIDRLGEMLERLRKSSR